MRVKSTIIVLLVLALTVVLGVCTYTGLGAPQEEYKADNIYVGNIIPGINGIRKGLDVAGGVRLIYSIEGEDIPLDGATKVQNILRNRLDAKGLNEATVSRDLLNPENPMIVVEIPGFDDPKEASEFLGQTAKLQFLESDWQTVVIEGTDIVGATVVYGPTSDTLAGNQYQVQLQLSSDATKKFGDATEKMSELTDGQNFIAIVLDENVISYPSVTERIDTTSPVITGGFTQEQAKELADLISSGALPFDLVSESQEYIGPTIGQKALDITIEAGFIALIIIMLILLM